MESLFITFSPNIALLRIKLGVPKSSFGDHRVYAPQFRTPIRRFWTVEIHGHQTKIFKSQKMWVMPFASTFHTPKYSFWAKSDVKCLQKDFIHLFFDFFQTFRLGSISLCGYYWVIYCKQFISLVAQIEY